jgi:hypothetical protein
MVIAASLAALGSGCASEPTTAYFAAPLARPQRPALPPLTREELACLAPDVYARLWRREALRRYYAEQLETIIEASHGHD